MRSKILGTCVLLLAATTVALAAGCGGAINKPAEPSSSAPAKKEAAPAQPAPKEGVIELKFDHHEPAQGFLGKTYQKYADTVAEKSGGKLRITVYPSETLGKAADSYPNVVNGISDIAWVVINFLPGQFPRSEAFNLPMRGIESGVMGAKVASEWFKTSPDLQKEWSEVKVLAVYCNGVGYLHTSKKPVRNMNDAAGLKIRASGFGPTNFAKAIGANPVAMAPPELYESLSKGIVEGYFWDWQGVLGNRTYELTKYSLSEPIYNTIMFMAMNKKKWESLSPELQKVLEDPGLTPSLPEFLASGFDAADTPGIEAFKKNGGEITELSAEERQKWVNIAKPVWSAWVETVKSKGIDGQKVLDDLAKIIEKHKTKK